MADLFLALLHHPVLDKNGQIVTTAVTNMDIHDIARSAATYGVRRFFVVTPVPALRALSEKIIEHWETGYGSTYNLTRKEALALVAVQTDLDGVLAAIENQTRRPPTTRPVGGPPPAPPRPAPSPAASVSPGGRRRSAPPPRPPCCSSAPVGVGRRSPWPERTSASNRYSGRRRTPACRYAPQPPS